MQLHSLIVHKIDKAPNQNPALTLRDDVIPVGARESEFVEAIKNAYYKRSNPIFGVFDPNAVTYPFQTMLRSHIDGRSTFLEFSVSAMQHLEAQMTHPQATGGYVLFAHYTSQNQEFALTVILNDQKAYNISDELDLSEILSIAVDKLDVANTVNLTRWSSSEERYLSFVRGRKDVSDYFLTFIGCTTNVDAKRSSEVFKAAFESYIAGQNMPHEDEARIRDDVYDYTHKQILRGDEISLAQVSSMLNQNEPNLFAEFAAAEDYGVSPTFSGHQTTLKNLKFFSYTGGGLSIKFNKGEWNDQIQYNADERTLTIRRIPEPLAARLAELGLN